MKTANYILMPTQGYEYSIQNEPDEAFTKETTVLGLEGLAEAFDFGFAGGLFSFLMKLSEILPGEKSFSALKLSINPNNIASNVLVAKESRSTK